MYDLTVLLVFHCKDASTLHSVQDIITNLPKFKEVCGPEETYLELSYHA